MCDTCGCNVTDGNRHLIEGDGKLARTESGNEAISVLQNLLSENDRTAAHNREHFDRHRVLAVNLMSSPGSGKTRAARGDHHSARRFTADRRDRGRPGDRERRRSASATRGSRRSRSPPAPPATWTPTWCTRRCTSWSWTSIDILFIENVGNLVCPASFDLGQHRNVTLLSVTEGDDKPAKYPVMFRAADLMLITKSDLLAVLDDFVPEKAERHLRELASTAPVITLSARSGGGMQGWLDWLRKEYAAAQTRALNGETLRPAIQPDGQLMHAHDATRPHHHGGHHNGHD